MKRKNRKSDVRKLRKEDSTATERQRRKKSGNMVVIDVDDDGHSP